MVAKVYIHTIRQHYVILIKFQVNPVSYYETITKQKNLKNLMIVLLIDLKFE